MAKNLKKILVFTDWFEPGFKAGGPIRSCVNFVYHMKSDYQILVFTSDRDLGDEEPYNGIIADQWIEKEQGVKLFYASPGFLTWKNIRSEIVNASADFIYLNSMFSISYSLYPLLIKRFTTVSGKVVLAPRGMLRESALAFKSAKKKIFLSILNRLNIVRGIDFHATDATEVNDVRKQFGKNTKVKEISNFPGVQCPFIPVSEKLPGKLKMIFTGRIHPIKNLAFLLHALQSTPQYIKLTVVAAIEDPEYWKHCEGIISTLPDNVSTQLISNLPHDQLGKLLLEHHLFCLPTLGENFGHAIYESLAAGRPVLISNQTPWTNLEEKHAGWDLPLTDVHFTRIINQVAAMNLQELNGYCLSAWKFCNDFNNRSDIKKEYLKLFS